MHVDCLETIKKIDFKYKCALITAFVMGIISQGMGLFNKYSVHDDPMNYGVGATYTSGRWMLDILAKIESAFFGDSHYSLPTYNGLFAILLIAVSACLIIKIIEIKNPLLCSFISGLMVCFPVITSIFGYMFTLHFYMIALVLAILGAYCVCKSDKWYIWCLGIISMGASVGIYQAFVPVTFTILLFHLIDFVTKNDNCQLILKKTILLGVSCVLFMSFYFVINKFYLSSHNAVLSHYFGIDSMGKSSIREYIHRAIYAYKEFFIPDSKARYFMFPGTVLHVYRVIILLSIALSIQIVIRVIKENLFRGITIAILIAMIPISVNSIFVMAGDAVHSLMVYAQLMPFVYFTWTIENAIIEKRVIKKGLSYASAVLMLSLLIMYSRVDNICYLKATYAQQESISFFTSLVSNIKDSNGYKDDYPIAFINENNISDLSLQSSDNEMMSNIRYMPYGDVNNYVNDWAWLRFMKQWTGFSPTVVDGTPFAGMDEVKKMPSYPDDGSIAIINDTVVVKF